MPVGNSGVLDGIRRIGGAFRDIAIGGGLPGAPYGYRLRGATLTGPPQTGTWKARDLVPDSSGALWQCIAAGTPGTWIRVGDMPWQFRPETFGAKRNGVVVTDAVMTSGSPNLACTTSNPFTGASPGMRILVSTAAGSYAHLATTILSVSGPGNAVLAANATANTGGTPGAIAYFGSDDTAAIQACINAATAYATANNGYAEVVFSDGIYIIAGAFTAISGRNCQLGLPVITPGAATQVTLMLRGAMETTPLMHWVQLQPQASGTVLASVSTSGTDDATNGPSSVIGSPVNGYGHEPGLFSNALIKIRGIGMLLPYNAKMGGVDLYGMVEADVDSLTVQTAAVVPTSSAPAPSLATTGNISNQWSFALRMPDTGNQVVSRVGQLSTEGLCYGLCPSEWTYAEDVHVMYAIIAIAPYSQSATEAHSALIVEVQAENCGNALGPSSWASTTARQVAIDIVNLQAESVQHPIFDNTSLLQGTVGVRILGYTGYNSSFFQGGTGGNLLRLVNKFNTPGVGASLPAVPATTVALPNYYYRDATVYVTSGGAAVTAIAVDSTTTGLTLGTTGTVAVRVPSGHTITWTGAGAAPTMTWILD